MAKLSTNSQFCTKHPDLQNWQLLPGTIEVLKNISDAAASCVLYDVDDLESVQRKVFDKCIRVATNLVLSNVLLNFDGKPKCEIVCPFDSCQDSTKLSLIKQASLFAPPKFNTHNFERHINTKHLNRKRRCDEEKNIPKKKLMDSTQFDIIDCDISTRTENASGLIVGTFCSTPIRQKFPKDQSQLVTPKTLKIVMLGEQLSTANNKIKELENNQTTKNATTSLSGPNITPKSARIDKLSDDLMVSKEVASKLREENFLLRYKYTDALSRIQTACRIKPDTSNDSFAWSCSDGNGLFINRNIQICKHKIDAFL